MRCRVINHEVLPVPTKKPLLRRTTPRKWEGRVGPLAVVLFDKRFVCLPKESSMVPKINFLRGAVAIIGLAMLGVVSLIGLSGVGGGSPASAATAYKVNVGGGGRGIAVEAFMPKSIRVHEGDTIEFANPYEEIHT